MRWFRKIFREGKVLLVALSLQTGGCAYYQQAIDGQMQIARCQRPIVEIIGDRMEDESLRRRLELAGDLCDFAELHLDLPSGGNYTEYVDVGREHVVWSVFAAPEFSLEAKRWWYPVVGKLSYRGFFRRDMAVRVQEDLASRGYDVFVGGVDAYSTLGWFRDPVVNTFVGYRETAFAELLFHELTHRRIYLSGKTEFNEALATAVAEEGVRRWLVEQGRLKDLDSYERELLERRRFHAEVFRAREELREVYEGKGLLTDDAMRERKALILGALRVEYEKLLDRREDRLLNQGRPREWNNARINATSTYYSLVPDFEALLAKEKGDFERFFEAVAAMGRATSRGRTDPMKVSPRE